MLTIEAKFVVIADATKYIIWICHFLHIIHKYYIYELKPINILFTKPKPTQLGINNQGILALALNPTDYQQSKHICI
jgi:hypothetical protein